MTQPLVGVVVLGDLGRSPRMVRHALALARHGAQVDLIGLAGREPDPRLAEAGVRVHRLRDAAPPGAGAAGWLAPARAAIRALAHGAALARRLARLPRPDVLLVQNPPAAPTLPVSIRASRRRGARLVMDWHNLSHAMLGARWGRRHPLVAALRRLEARWARRAAAHLCVTEALGRSLAGWLDVAPAVVRDAPDSSLRRLHPEERRASRVALAGVLGEALDDATALAVSPTSFSLDEDFGMLFDALARYEAAGEGPPLVVLVTGDGPGRAGFEARARASSLRRVRIRTGWLPAAEYARLLGSADLGLCLHVSASGLDFPIKLTDMRGAGLPACAFDYGSVLTETVAAEGGVATFGDAGQLAERLRELLAGHPGSSKLAELSGEIRPLVTWDEEWERHARAVLLAGVGS